MACALASAGLFWLRGHGATQPVDLVSLLPAADATIVYVDIDALRSTGILNLLAGAKAVEDADYQQFVRETQFDYRTDLDAIAAAFKEGKVYFAVRGRFRWSHLRDFVAHQGGSCHNEFCVVAGSQPNRRISFYPLRRDVMAMAVAPDDFAAYQVTTQSAKLSLPRPKEPVWALIPAVALQKMDTLPAVAKAYVPALQGADQIVFSIGTDANKQLNLSVHVSCKDPSSAVTLLTQFENTTKALRDTLSRNKKTPDPADLSGVLVAGNFYRDQSQVFGAWPIPRQFVDSLTSGSAY
jgi:hypothetical protein